MAQSNQFWKMLGSLDNIFPSAECKLTFATRVCCCDQGCCHGSVSPALMREWGTIALHSACPVSDLGYPHRHRTPALLLATADWYSALIGWSSARVQLRATTSRVNERHRCIAHRHCPSYQKFESDERLYIWVHPSYPNTKSGFLLTNKMISDISRNLFGVCLYLC